MKRDWLGPSDRRSAGGLVLAWSYLTTEISRAIEARLPSEEQLNAMSPDELAGIKSKLTTAAGGSLA